MKNILNGKPSEDFLHRLAYSAAFVQDQDVKEKRILDIGCGFGWFEIEALNRGVKEIIGIEISENDLITAKKSIVKNNVIFQAGNAIDLPFEGKGFDTVVSWDVIEHIPKKNENKMFSEIRRVLRDNGVFYLSSPYKHIISIIFDPAWWLIGHRHYSYEDLIYYAKKNGFEPESFSIRGGWWEVFGIWDLYISKWIFRRKIFFEDFLYRKLDSQSNSDRGFASIFCKFKTV